MITNRFVKIVLGLLTGMVLIFLVFLPLIILDVVSDKVEEDELNEEINNCLLGKSEQTYISYCESKSGLISKEYHINCLKRLEEYKKRCLSE